jgi:cell fate regulator YaaT (PSP1 superfamily)
MSKTVLVRYGAISEVARFANASGESLRRGTDVVVHTHRGVERGVLLEDAAADRNGVNGNGADLTEEPQIKRFCTADDLRQSDALRSECEAQFGPWQTRIREWNLQLELIDLEWTLDRSKLILYVLNDRGPECTRLALQAAAAGFGVVEVQSVGPDGLVATPSGHGCGSGGCGSGGESNGCCH